MVDAARLNQAEGVAEISEAAPRRPLARFISFIVITWLGLTVLYFVVGAFLMLGSRPEPITDLRRYSEALSIFRQLHGSSARFLPPDIPASAKSTRLFASLDDMLQAEPYLDLEMQLASGEASAELDRLLALRPTSEQPERHGRRIAGGDDIESEHGIRLDFASPNASLTIIASVWHDPDTGWFLYTLLSD